MLSFWQLLLNPWGLLQYAHNMTGAVITGSFVMAAMGAFYLLENHREEYARIFLKVGVIAGLVCLHPHHLSHRRPSRQICCAQPACGHRSNGRFVSRRDPAPASSSIGQPNEETGQIDNPIVVNNLLSFLIYGTTKAEVKGLDSFPHDQWPTALPLLYYAYHIMAGLGTWFLLLMTVAAFLLWRGRLYTTRWALWALLLSFPLPYIANTAGWMTAELGRQPWLIYGLMRTSEGYSSTVSAGNGLFTLHRFHGALYFARPAVHHA